MNDDVQKALDVAVEAYAASDGPALVTGYVLVFHSAEYEGDQEIASYRYATAASQPDHISMGLLDIANALVHRTLYGGNDE